MSTPDRTPRVVAAPRDLVEAAAQSKLEHALFGGGELVRVGRYVVIEPVGSGGFGDVYVAFDPKLDRRVAVKLVRGRIRGGAVRMLREAQALAKVTHPNVVGVYDAGVVVDPRGDEQLYIVMEYVDGMTLAQWLALAPRPWRAVLATFVAAGRGLAAVHRAELVHHDFKPSNVLVGERADSIAPDAARTRAPERVRVADFGLAGLTGASRPDDAAVIAAIREDAFAAMVTPPSVVGTPAYMAPEQHFGHPTDARADQFAFAVALFEALYGVRPHAGDSVKEIADDKLHGRIVDPPHQGAPPSIRAVLRRALAPRPEDRHRDLEAMLAALERRTAKWPLVAVLFALALGGAAALELARDPAEQVELGEVERATRAARDAAALALFVYPLPDDERAATAYRRVLELEEIDTTPARTRATELRDEFAATLCRLGDRYWDLDGGRGFALDYYVQALVFVPDHQHARERAALPPGRWLALESRAATGAFTQAELRATAPLVALAHDDPAERAEAVQQIVRRTEQSSSTRAELERVLASDRTKARVRAEPAARPAEAPVETPAPDESSSPPPELVEPASADPAAAREALDRGRELVAAGRWHDAERAFHRAIELDKRNVRALAGLAAVYFELRSYRKARDVARRAVALAPRDAELRITLGDAAFKLLDYAEARTHYERARKLGSEAATRRLATLDELTGARP